ncbi:uncharacterized protein LOC122274506 [Carya illinoinensis]|uniref:uncharacterized protein LOC122274506 n=1 Tax=Carya illinoinensis TaxID=32201 RepID=UPI001C717C01|nr:uncharacterized protein LOC122274506 [Carya illinoinensis]
MWKPSPMHTYKLNWDAALDRIQSRIGIGVVVRDYEGRILATMRKNKCLFPDPLLAEAYGTLQATTFGLELGLRKIILQGDSLQITQALKKKDANWTSVGMFVSEAKEIRKNFLKRDVLHVRRDGNVIAHVLAKDALVISDVIVTMEESPPFISDLI